jgi:hypothetical protein
MQSTGYILDDQTGEKILVLMRQSNNRRTATHRSFKRRVSGKEGNYFEDESIFLNERRDRLELLKAGQTINC